MAVLSFDIGIKNLSLCMIDGEDINNHKILDWNIWDLRTYNPNNINIIKEKNENINEDNNEDTIKPEFFKKNICICFTKSNKPCKSEGIYYETLGNKTLFYCKKHKGKARCKFIEKDAKKITKMKKQECLDYIQDNNIPFKETDKLQCRTVADLKKYIKSYIFKNCVKQIETPKKCKSYSLNVIHKNLYKYVNSFLDKYADKITQVQIENQPVKLNATMKTIQIMLYSLIYNYYYIRDNLTEPNVIFINAKYKGTVYDGPNINGKGNTDYKVRKDLSVEHSKYFLNHSAQEKWLEFFMKNKKRDDLADAYLMCLYHIKK